MFKLLLISLVLATILSQLCPTGQCSTINNLGAINNNLLGGFDINTHLGSLGLVGNSLTSAGSIGLGGFNTGLGGLSTNVGSLNLIGNGVGLNTTGLGAFNNDASFVLNTPSLTGNVFTQTLNPTTTSTTTITSSNIGTPALPTSLTTITPTTITTTPAPVMTAVTTVPDIPGFVALKVKDSNGAIIHINNFNASRTSMALTSGFGIDKLTLFNSQSIIGSNFQDIVRDTIHQGEFLYENQYIRSSNKAYFLVLRNDGNLILYCSRVLIPRNIIWSSNTAGQGTVGQRKLTLTNTGNIILTSGDSGYKTWQSKTSSNSGPFKLALQNDGNLVLYAGLGGKALWSSGTVRR